jgi:hypothetical protein
VCGQTLKLDSHDIGSCYVHHHSCSRWVLVDYLSQGQRTDAKALLDGPKLPQDTPEAGNEYC